VEECFGGWRWWWRWWWWEGSFVEEILFYKVLASGIRTHICDSAGKPFLMVMGS